MKSGSNRSASGSITRPVFWAAAVLAAVFVLAGFSGIRDSPCREPVTYRIGSVDERFGVSPHEVAQAAEQAVSVWEEASGMDLFREDREGSIEINLVYDYRQAAADRLKGISGKIENARSFYESLKLWLATREEQLREQQNILRQDIEAYNGRVRDLNDRFEAASRGGSMSRDVYRDLTVLKGTLDQEREALKERQDELSGEAQALNDLVMLINQIARSLNLEVVNYNRAGKPLQDEFREGCFEKKNGRQSITVYYFSDHDRLVRLLAHELGHALGLDHSDNPEALMYRVNQGQCLDLAPEDIASLRELCGGKR